MVINTNLSAMAANTQALRISGAVGKHLERLSTGLKINRGEDDPSGLGMARKTQAQIRGTNVAIHNVEESIHYYNLRDALMEEDSQIIQRMRDIAVRAANEAPLTDRNRAELQAEMEKLRDEIDRMAKSSPRIGVENQRLLYAPGKLDVVWILDHSYSMEPFVQNLEDAADAMFEGFKDKGFSLRMGAIGFGDNAHIPLPLVPPGPPPPGSPVDATAASVGTKSLYDNAAAFSADVGAIRAFASNMFNGMGAERGLDATLETLYSVPTLGAALRPDANKVFILVTDEGSDDNGEEGPPGSNSPTAAQIQMTIDALNAENVILDVVGEWNWYDPGKTLVSADPDPAYQQVANATGGLVQRIDTNGNWVNPIVSSLENMASDWNALYQIGPDNSIDQRIDVDFKSITTSTLGLGGVNVSTVAMAQTTIDDIDNGMNILNDERAFTADIVKRLQHIANDLAAMNIGNAGFKSGLEDADMHEEFVNITIQNMLSNTVTAAQAQANANPESASAFLSTVENAEQVDQYGRIFTVQKSI